MNLCIDVGNTITKAAVFSGPEIIAKNKWSDTDNDTFKEGISELITDFPQLRDAILCSVRSQNSILTDILKRHFPRLVILNENTPIPFQNLYETGSTLGKDRLAAIAGANNIYPGRNVLVIDAGTAITYDVIDEHSRYHGGNISPGLFMRLKALHTFTARLPLVKPRPEVPLIAGNTEEAIAAGVQNGIIFEIESYISRLEDRFSDLVIIFTGGDSGYFDKKLKNTIFAHPDLILAGLNRILTYNVENN